MSRTNKVARVVIFLGGIGMASFAALYLVASVVLTQTIDQPALAVFAVLLVVFVAAYIATNRR